MSEVKLYFEGKMAEFFVEETAFPGVKRVANTVAEDIELVTGVRPVVAASAEKLTSAGETTGMVVIAATLGKSVLCDRLVREGKLLTEALYKENAEGKKPKREVYTMQFVEQPFAERPDITSALVILGSDKRGTIYGLFTLSELCGVSPLVYFGDAKPEKKDSLVITLDTPVFSKEPSVKYRGFFINDEWPAFGGWCMERFGGVNAKAYEKIFELLLRLKGNYFWPAMWNSSFSEDGPGIENARLADEYGVVMGSSHHEPLCRAGVEWQRKYKEYGDDSTWSFFSNDKAITEFWKDGLLRNKDFENVITIGMRGENDSKLLSEDATMKDNVEILKRAIRVQNRLIAEHVNPELTEVPRMLAIYKEVEEYYYGDETCEGLRHWDELKDVIFLLSDDNFGHLRALPDENDRKHPGGFGMYYHFDYHGGPISFEWQNSTRLSKVWEQMTMAYEYGVRDMWIVNVGDLKGVEYPLYYFMELAYDFDRWGSSNVNSASEFAKFWIGQQFGAMATAAQKQSMLEVLEGFVKFNAIRRPEAMNAGIYHPVHFREGERIGKAVTALMDKAKELKHSLPAECQDAFQSMIYYPAVISLNMVLMNIEAGRNHDLANRGSTYANIVGERVEQRIMRDHSLVKEYHSILGGKWCHMMDSAHTGFRSWNDYDWTYPTVHKVTPLPAAKPLVGFAGNDAYTLGPQWGAGAPICNEEFLRPDTKQIMVVIESRGSIDFSYQLECDKTWLEFSGREGRIDASHGGRDCIRVTLKREQLTQEEKAVLTFHLTFANGEKKDALLAVKANGAVGSEIKDCYMEHGGIIAINAEHYSSKQDVETAGFRIVPEVGRLCDGVKCFPVTCDFSKENEKPSVTYRFATKQAGNYTVEFQLAARNPVLPDSLMGFSYSVNGGEEQNITTISGGFCTDSACREWSSGVLNNVRSVTAEAELFAGENSLTVYAGEPGLILERILVYRHGTKLPYSYLGPEESFIQYRQ